MGRLAPVGLLIALLTTLAIQPATAAAQSISYSSGPRNLISGGLGKDLRKFSLCGLDGIR